MIIFFNVFIVSQGYLFFDNIMKTIVLDVLGTGTVRYSPLIEMRRK